jgi:hypothetical protein
MSIKTNASKRLFQAGLYMLSLALFLTGFLAMNARITWHTVFSLAVWGIVLMAVSTFTSKQV